VKHDALSRYAVKRRFGRTAEPTPKRSRGRSGPLLFVVQKHAARRLHYDFRLELDGVLKSWAVPKGPSLEVGEKRLAVPTEDHPFEYASFEGSIPAGEYGGGQVIVWDCGTYSPDEEQRYAFGDRRAAERRVRAGLEAGKLSFFLRGEKLRGSFALVRTGQGQWLLLKHRDRFAADDDVLAQARSVLCDATVEEIAARTPVPMPAAELIVAGPRESFPAALTPMLAQTSPGLTFGSDWRFEPKLDGYRVIAFLEGSEVRLASRRRQDLTALFPEIVAELRTQAVESMILDGEIIVLADGKPSFNALQNRAQLKHARDISRAQAACPAVLVCFDLLHFAGIDVRAASYSQRQRFLSQCLLPGAHVQRVHVADDAQSLYEVAIGNGFEGIVAKRLQGRYQPGRRSPDWRKVKMVHSAEFVIGGYTRGRGAREPLGALLLGYWRNRRLRYAGHVGSGLTDAVVSELRRQAATLETPRAPFTESPPLHRPTTWLTPTLVAEVSFSEWTPDGLLRAPVFLRLRPDLAARDVGVRVGRVPGTRAGRAPAARTAVTRVPIRPVAEARGEGEIAHVIEQLRHSSAQLDLLVGGARVRLTHLDRAYWPANPRRRQPAITKRDLIRYLAAVSPYMLPHLRDRPLTMIRMPDGVSGQRFFQKHWDAARPEFVDTVEVFSEHVGGRHAYIVANNLPTLLWLGQNGTLEYHVWHSRARPGADTTGDTDYASSLASLKASVLNFPDYLVFDLDPYIYSGKEAAGDEPEYSRRGFAVGKRVAFWLRSLLQEMSLEPVVKTSGKTGLHVFVPIDRTVTFDQARHICETVGRHLLQQHPREITMEWAVKKRTGRIFIDYNMNVRGKTLNVAYSPRGLPGAPISMPLTWKELETAEPGDFTLQNVLQRLDKAGDRWHDVLSKKQSLTQAFGSNSRS
jgi:bifunctional non-homologous end joining protein LigD